ncbi:hypothetical protein VNI00_010930 [Paramarasmius palmivorus]|uniref:Protein kinase domain-containing protein n=1 Tax=Paramarasmius palmivorus TaxID=297713 RepID=A0AAW0CHS9_9AGAR
MENGNLVDFLRAQPRKSVDRIRLMHDIASGLSYLHRSNIVHGDLKGANVLITRSHRACIADFGLSRVSDSLVPQVTTTADQTGGSARWSAPEIHNGQSSTKKSDIYSCGCLFYEVVTGLPPFHNITRDIAIVMAVLRGKRPSRPESIDVPDRLWALLENCWDAEPTARPTVDGILKRLPGGVIPAEDWDEMLFTQLRRNVTVGGNQHPRSRARGERQHISALLMANPRVQDNEGWRPQYRGEWEFASPSSWGSYSGWDVEDRDGRWGWSSHWD